MKDYQSVVLRIRKALDLYANLRPVKANGFDIMIVRENTEGLYSGIEERGPDRATTLRVVTRKGTGRIAGAAIRLAKKRQGRLTIGHKANVLKSDVFFRDICIEEAKKAGRIVFREVHRCTISRCSPAPAGIRCDRDYEHLWRYPLGCCLLPCRGAWALSRAQTSATATALFEPVHGSAPDIAGKDSANPIACPAERRHAPCLSR